MLKIQRNNSVNRFSFGVIEKHLENKINENNLNQNSDKNNMINCDQSKSLEMNVTEIDENFKVYNVKNNSRKKLICLFSIILIILLFCTSLLYLLLL